MIDVAVVGASPDVDALVVGLADVATVTVVPPGLGVLDAGADVALIDARGQLGAARRLAALIPCPTLALVRAAELDDLPGPLADDLVVEGCPAAELRARVRLLAAPAPLVAAGVAIDAEAYRASVDGRPLDLTYTEFELLKFLVANPDRVHSRDVLLAEVWGEDYFGGTRTVDVHVRRLRAKLGSEHESLIETVRQVGYRFSPR